MKTVSINLYKFEELNKEAQEKAIQEHADFLLETDREEFEREDIIDNIIVNEYYFFEDGELAYTIKYTNNHPQAGREELHFYNKIIEI